MPCFTNPHARKDFGRLEVYPKVFTISSIVLTRTSSRGWGFGRSRFLPVENWLGMFPWIQPWTRPSHRWTKPFPTDPVALLALPSLEENQAGFLHRESLTTDSLYHPIFTHKRRKISVTFRLVKKATASKHPFHWSCVENLVCFYSNHMVFRQNLSPLFRETIFFFRGDEFHKNLFRELSRRTLPFDEGIASFHYRPNIKHVGLDSSTWP